MGRPAPGNQSSPGFPAVAPLSSDFRGWSRSSDLPGPYTLDQLRQDTLGIIQAAGLTDYVLVGHSMGGKIAQLVAATHPKGLTGLVLVASGPARPATEVTLQYRVGLSHAYDSDETVVSARDNILTATALTDELKAQVLSDSRSSAPDARTEWPLRGIAQDITSQAREIQVPVLVIAGEHDQVEPIETLLQTCCPTWPARNSPSSRPLVTSFRWKHPRGSPRRSSRSRLLPSRRAGGKTICAATGCLSRTTPRRQLAFCAIRSSEAGRDGRAD